MKKKVWIMNHYAADMYRDKAGRHYWFAKKLKERGYSPVVFCANTFHNKAEQIDTKGKKICVKKDDGIPYVFVKTVPSMGNGLDRVRNMFGFYRHLFPAAKMYAKKYGKPDVIIASSVHPLTMVAGIQLARRMRIPCICEIRDLWPEAIFAFGKVKENSLLGKILTTGEHWIYKNADALIFTKEGDHDYLIEQGWTTEQGGNVDLKKCYYINNGVNIEAFEESIRSIKMKDEDLEKSDKFNVTYAGMLRPVNNVGQMLDAAKLLKDEPDIQFLIYGSGSQLEELKERVEREKITNVKMKGFVERKYIPYILSKSNVNILNYSQSQYNWSRGNSSNKLFEYLASGKPVISTVKMGYDIIERYQCGMSIEQCNARNLAKSIRNMKRMQEEEYERYCLNAKKAASNFDFNVLTEKLTEVIESVI